MIPQLILTTRMRGVNLECSAHDCAERGKKEPQNFKQFFETTGAVGCGFHSLEVVLMLSNLFEVIKA